MSLKAREAHRAMAVDHLTECLLDLARFMVQQITTRLPAGLIAGITPHIWTGLSNDLHAEAFQHASDLRRKTEDQLVRTATATDMALILGRWLANFDGPQDKSSAFEQLISIVFAQLRVCRGVDVEELGDVLYEQSRTCCYVPSEYDSDDAIRTPITVDWDEEHADEDINCTHAESTSVRREDSEESPIGVDSEDRDDEEVVVCEGIGAGDDVTNDHIHDGDDEAGHDYSLEYDDPPDYAAMGSPQGGDATVSTRIHIRLETPAGAIEEDVQYLRRELEKARAGKRIADTPIQTIAHDAPDNENVRISSNGYDTDHDHEQGFTNTNDPIVISDDDDHFTHQRGKLPRRKRELKDLRRRMDNHMESFQSTWRAFPQQRFVNWKAPASSSSPHTQ